LIFVHVTLDGVHPIQGSGVRDFESRPPDPLIASAVTISVMPKAKSLDANAVLFGTIIYRMRTERRWTLEDLGRVSGMNSDWLGVLERGLNVPSLTTILRLADAFGVEAASLVRDVELLRTWKNASAEEEPNPAEPC
jgi:DNA-binding XRE family transcriptional regulator